MREQTLSRLASCIPQQFAPIVEAAAQQRRHRRRYFHRLGIVIWLVDSDGIGIIPMQHKRLESLQMPGLGGNNGGCETVYTLKADGIYG